MPCNQETMQNVGSEAGIGPAALRLIRGFALRHAEIAYQFLRPEWSALLQNICRNTTGKHTSRDNDSPVVRPIPKMA